jgi:hypothetical protein
MELEEARIVLEDGIGGVELEARDGSLEVRKRGLITRSMLDGWERSRRRTCKVWVV